jgi:tetratricopeptide (TPR) repeat protein
MTTLSCIRAVVETVLDPPILLPVSLSSPVAAHPFVSAVQPFLEARDGRALTDFLRAHYTSDDLCSLLATPQADVAKVAALALGMVGDGCCVPCLVDRLADPDPVVHQMAEHALWNVWFRAGSPAANEHLCRGTRCLNDRDFDCAFKHFNAALALCPDFAEVYHQRGLAWSLLDEYEKAIADYRQAARLMPCHFGAWAGLGQCYAMLERIEPAIEAYERARDINPRIEGIAQALGDLRRLAQRRRPAPGGSA